MKKFAKLIGFIAIVAVIGFAVIGCDNGTDDDSSADPFKGTWEMSEGGNQIVAANGEFIQSQDMGTGIKPFFKGTYTVSENTATITFTHIDQNQTGTWAPYTPPDQNHPPTVVYGTISGGILTVTVNEQQYDYTKQQSSPGGPGGPGGPGVPGGPGEGNSDLLAGTWEILGGGNQIVAANGEFIQSQDMGTGIKPFFKGTYTVSENTATITFTHIDQAQSGTWTPYTGPTDPNFPPVTVQGTISGDTFIVTVNGQQHTFTKDGSGGPGGPGEGNSGSIVGTWYGETTTGEIGTMTFFSNETFEIPDGMKGTYTTVEGILTLSITQLYGGVLSEVISDIQETWYTKAEMKTVIKDYMKANLVGQGLLENAAETMAESLTEQMVDQMYAPLQVTYSVDDDTLTMTAENDEGQLETSTLTRQS